MWLLMWAAIVKWALSLPGLFLQHWALVLSLASAAVSLSGFPLWLRFFGLVLTIGFAACWGGKNKVVLPAL